MVAAKGKSAAKSVNPAGAAAAAGVCAGGPRVNGVARAGAAGPQNWLPQGAVHQARTGVEG